MDIIKKIIMNKTFSSKKNKGTITDRYKIVLVAMDEDNDKLLCSDRRVDVTLNKLHETLEQDNAFLSFDNIVDLFRYYEYDRLNVFKV